MKKKLCSILLALCLMLTLLPATALAADDVITISDAAGFKNFIEANDTYLNKKIVLSDNIDMKNAALIPYASVFRGEFDGNGKTVSNFTIDKPLFGLNIGMQGVVKNLTVENATLNNTQSGQQRIGLLCRNLIGKLENVTVKDCIITSTTEALGVVGGLAAIAEDYQGNSPTIKDCTVTALTVNAPAGAASIGGAVGLLKCGENATVEDVQATGTTIATLPETPVGALWGLNTSACTPTECDDSTAPTVTFSVEPVAEVGDVKYSTLQAAVDAAKTGDTVKVIKDIEVTLADMPDPQNIGTNWIYYTLTRIKKDLTLDLNGHTISIAESAKTVDTSTKSYLYRLFVLQMGANVTVTGNGKISGDGGNAKVTTFNISKSKNTASSAKTHLTIENGEFSANGIELVHAYEDTTCTINGGTFKYLSDGSGTTVLNCQGESNYAFSITGGTYINFDPRHMNDGDLVADGYCVKKSVDGTNTLYTVGEHDASRTSAVTTAPTYSSEGVRTYYCAHCGAEVDTASVARLVAASKPLRGVSVANTSNGEVDSNHDEARQGSIVTVTAAPDAGYTLESLTVLDKNGNALTLNSLGGNKYSFIMPDGDVTVRASFTNGSAAAFVDVPAGKYFTEPVAWAVGSGITGGTDATHFSPYASCTRGQLVTFLWRAAGEPEAKTTVNPFSDVKETSAFYKAILWASENGIVGGYADGTFRPSQAVTRQQVAAILYRYAKYAGMDVSVGEDTNILSFNDAFSVSEYAIAAFQWAVGEGVITGNDGSLLPHDTCTRAQIVTMLYRLLAD